MNSRGFTLIEMLAAMLIVWDDRMSYALASGFDPSRADTGAGPLTRWQCIRDSLSKGRTYNFCGSTLPGVERYVRSWGGELRSVIWAERIRQPLFLMLHTWKKYKAAVRLASSFRDYRSSRERAEGERGA